MTTYLSKLALVLGIAMALPVTARMQDKPPSAPGKAAPVTPVVPLKIQVVISRFQGEKKLSSLPYVLTTNSVDAADHAGHANLRMGTKVPITMVTAPTVDGKPMTGIPTVNPIQYQDVGTNIDCFVRPMDDGRFRIDVTIDDSSVYTEEKDSAVAKGAPSIRSFRAGDSMILKDGGTAQFTTAADKVSGEIVKVDVTLTVVK